MAFIVTIQVRLLLFISYLLSSSYMQYLCPFNMLVIVYDHLLGQVLQHI
jgi:hypothetical protein